MSEITTGFRMFWSSIALYLAYFTRIRAVWNWLMQKIYDKNPPKNLPVFDKPQDIWDYAQPKFQYRHDPALPFLPNKKGLLDYHSEPEVFQYRLDDEKVDDGDCDDIAWWFAKCVSTADDVLHVAILNSGFKSKKKDIDSAHSTVVFYMRGTGWFHFDYGVKPIKNPYEAVERVTKRYTQKADDAVTTWWTYEDMNMKPLAICPKKL